MFVFLPMLFILPIILALFAFWIWMLISAIQNRGISEGEKVAWVLVVLFTHFLGAFIYFLLGHPKRNG